MPTNKKSALKKESLVKDIKKDIKEKVKEKKKRETFQSVKGIREILPEEEFWWDKFEKAVKKTAQFYNFRRIETGIVEQAGLFEKSLGDEVVNKEMFFLKSGGGKWVLRPEGTAPTARAYLQYGFSKLTQPVKLYYFGPMFRYENPQAGRYRQFYQAGFEIIGGENDAIFDAQTILGAWRFFEYVGLKDVEMKLNSIGCRSCRINITKRLVNYFKSKKKKLCKDCDRRLVENPLRILDCKKEECKEVAEGAPIFLDGLCSQCRIHFKNVLEYLEELKISYEIDNTLVRGLDYYNRTVFDFFYKGGEGKKLAIGGGGRYDYLMEMIGGRPTPACGFSLGVERVIEALKDKKGDMGEKKRSSVFFIHVGEVAKKRGLCLIEELRSAGIQVVESLSKSSLSKQLKLADKAKVELALIFGQKEVYEESVIIKNLKNGIQEVVPISKMVNQVKKKIK